MPSHRENIERIEIIAAGLQRLADDVVFIGRRHALKKTLPSGKVINLLPLAFFLATKLEASIDRGGGDYRNDHDMEDIITIIDGNENLEEILAAPDDVKSFIAMSFGKLLHDDDFKRAISGHIGFDTTATERAKLIEEKMAKVIPPPPPMSPQA